jgi:hypothetical protein
MIPLIPGCNGTGTAAFFGTAWYEEDDASISNPHKKVTPTHGQKPICQVCKAQIRDVDAPTRTDCRDDAAAFEGQTCTAFKPLPPETLALRMAELYHYIGIAWDTIMAVLEISSKLPEVKE